MHLLGRIALAQCSSGVERPRLERVEVDRDGEGDAQLVGARVPGQDNTIETTICRSNLIDSPCECEHNARLGWLTRGESPRVNSKLVGARVPGQENTMSRP